MMIAEAYTKLKETNFYIILFTLLLSSLPFSLRITNIIIAIIAGYWLLVDRNKKVKDYKILIILIFPFILHLIGISYSTNLKHGFFILEKILPLLIFPVIFSNISLSSKQRNFLITVFIYTIVSAAIYSLVFELVKHYQIYKTLLPINFDYFKLSELTQGIKLSPPYFGLYVSFSLIIISSLYQNNLISNILFLIIAFLLVFVLILSGARTAIVASSITFSSYWIIQNKLRGSLIALLCFGFLSLLIYNDNVLKERFIDATSLQDQNTTRSYSSLSLRLAKWNSAIDVICDNPFFGVGTGDSQEELNKSYLRNGVYEAYRRNYDAHNQYLEIALKLGLVGLSSLVLILTLGIFRSILTKDILYFFFIMIFSICLISESMLETQKGIVYFGFFNSLFAFSLEKEIVLSKIFKTDTK